jgi:tetratricopeptide (TPR) repeat protein
MAAALLSFCILACSSPEERAARHLARADAYLEAGQSREALLELRNALRVDPASAEASFRIARLLEDLGETSDASFFYTEAQRLDPNRVEAALADARLALGTRPERAQRLIEGVLERDPTNLLARVRRSELALAQGDTQAALEAVREALALGPDPEGAAALQLAVVQRTRLFEQLLAGEAFDPELAEATLKILETAEGRGSASWRVAFERANVLAAWPERAAEAAPLYREAVEDALRQAPRRERRAALLQAFRYAVSSEDRSLQRFVLEQWTGADAADLFAWQQLARLEEQEGGFAEPVFRRLLTQRPEDPDAHAFYVRYLVSQGRTRDARAHLQEAVDELERARPTLLGELVRLQLTEADLPAALQALERLEEEFPDHADTTLARARVRFRENRLEEAATALRKSAQVQSLLPAQRLLAEAELRLGHPELALPAIERALVLARGREARLWALKARAHHDLAEWSAAVRSFQRLAAGGVPLQHADALLLARCHYELGDPKRGRRLLERLLAEPSPATRAILEFARREAKRDPQAVRAALEAGLERTPRHPHLHAALTRLDLHEDRADAALARLNGVLGSGPATPQLLLCRARVFEQSGRYDAAEQDVRRVLKGQPDLPEAVRRFVQLQAASNRLEETVSELEASGEALSLADRVLLARLHLERGEWSRARELQEDLLARHPELAGVKSDLAYLLADQGEELDRAVRLATEARDALGDNPIAIDQLGYAYLRDGLPDLALEQFRRAADLAELRGHAEARLYHHRGLALRAQGQTDAARRAFEQALRIDPLSVEARDALEAIDEGVPAASTRSGPP